MLPRSTLHRLLILLLALLVVCGCAEKTNTIKLASAAPMSGQYAKMGEDISRAVRLAVDEWNARGGVLGGEVELTVEDDRADPKDAVSVANKIAAVGVVGVVGHYNSSCTIPASNIYHENGIIMITPASTNPMVTDRGYPEVFRTCGRDDQQGIVQAHFAATVLKADKVAILHDKTTYGQGLADEFRKNLPDTVEVVIYEGITVGDKDFSAILTRVKSLSPDLLMFGGLYAEGGLIAKQLRELGASAQFLSGDGVYDPEFIHIAGEAAEDAYISYAASPEHIPTARRFLAAYREHWGEPGPFSLFAYDAANLLITAIQRAGTTDGAKISQALHAGSFDGAMGTIAFDRKGDPIRSPYVMWQVRSGELVQLDSAAVAPK